jgi:hypothetical protein
MPPLLCRSRLVPLFGPCAAFVACAAEMRPSRRANDPTVFEGEWHDGKRNGFGTCYYDIDKKEVFTGQ